MLQLEIIGNLGSNARIKNINGKDYVSFDVAHEEKDGTGKKTIWVSVLWYGNGGNMMKWLTSGAKVFIRGRLSVSVYTSQKTGQTNASLSVMANEVQMCSFPKAENGGQQQSQMSGMIASAGKLAQESKQQDAVSLDNPEEDLPF